MRLVVAANPSRRKTRAAPPRIHSTVCFDRACDGRFRGVVVDSEPESSVCRRGRTMITMKNIRRFDLEEVPCAVALPNAETRGLPLCLFLYGGSGSRETLADIAPL